MDGFDAEDFLHAVVFFVLWVAISGIVTYALSYAVQNLVAPIAPVLGYLELLMWGIILALLLYVFNDRGWNWWGSIV
jgi:hypothetical protein